MHTAGFWISAALTSRPTLGWLVVVRTVVLAVPPLPVTAAHVETHTEVLEGAAVAGNLAVQQGAPLQKLRQGPRELALAVLTPYPVQEDTCHTRFKPVSHATLLP
jgi:hypothetical protein